MHAVYHVGCSGHALAALALLVLQFINHAFSGLSTRPLAVNGIAVKSNPKREAHGLLMDLYIGRMNLE